MVVDPPKFIITPPLLTQVLDSKIGHMINYVEKRRIFLVTVDTPTNGIKIEKNKNEKKRK